MSEHREKELQAEIDDLRVEVKKLKAKLELAIRVIRDEISQAENDSLYLNQVLDDIEYLTPSHNLEQT